LGTVPRQLSRQFTLPHAFTLVPEPDTTELGRLFVPQMTILKHEEAVSLDEKFCAGCGATTGFLDILEL
jgi:hypothetical protein